ncbi:YhdP family protein [Xanthobacter pseudotagetidis]|uniref:YhdP family protein n=1 Tax=Xanthobacter pseudotagetidis TaxID=3119911 RepID=UPI0037296747
MGLLVPQGRVARIYMFVCLGLIALGGVAAVTLYVLVASGVVTANIATPYIAQALAERIGGGHKVVIGSTTIETVDNGATAVVVHDIKVIGPDGQLVASAPSAEVELEGSLLSLAPKARRIDLVGAEMTVRIAASGHLAVATGRGAKPISPASLPTSAAPQGAAGQSAPAPAQLADPAALGAAVPGAASGDGVAANSDPLVLAVLARWTEELEAAGFDGGALADVGLKNGTLIVENESSGRRIVFQNIGVRLARPSGGGAQLTFTSQGPHGIATAVARIGPARDGARAVEMKLDNVSTRDLVQAFSQDHRRFYMDTPLDATLFARLGLDGAVKAAKAEFVFGAGAVGNGEAVDERFHIDTARLEAVLDPARRVIALGPIVAIKGQNRIGLKGEIVVPARVGDPWSFSLGPDGIVLAGEMSEPPVTLDRVAVSGRWTSPDKRLVVDKGFVGGPTGSMSFTAAFDFGMAAPTLFFDASTTPLPAATLKRVWPVSIAPPARQFVVENVSAGTADSLTVSVRIPMDLIGQKQIPLPDDAVDLKVAASGVTVRPVQGLPPVAGAKLAIAVTGRSVRIAMPSGTVVTPQNRKLAVSDGIMLIPDYFPREPTSQISVKFEGPADAGIEILGMEPLKGPTGTAFDPSTTRGRLSALLQVNIVFRKVMKPEDIDYSFEASLTDFGVDKVFHGQRLEGATVKAFASPAGVVLRGEGKLGGAPVAFEYEKKKDVADSDIRVSANLDDAARERLGVDVPGVFGTLGVRLVGTTNNKDTRASIEVDLTAARIQDLIPGLSKPAGKPLKARFTLNDKGPSVRLEDLVLDGSGTLLKGSLELSDGGELIGAQFPTFQLSDGDKAALRAERSGDVLKIRITGEVMDARGIMKSLVSTPPPSKKPQKTPDVDVDAKIGALTGNYGEVLRQFELQTSRRGVEMRAFVLTAKAGRDGSVAGEMRSWQGRQRALHVATSDAGAMLRFLDIYAKVQGGEAWLVIDPPRSDQTPQEGVLHIRDFAIKGEPGLDRLASAARDSSGRAEPGSAMFDKAQAQFARTTGKVTFREGAIWGPSVGATFDGTLDFAQDRMAMRGTFVPAYALNNMFSKLPLIGLFLGGGPNEGLLGVTFEIVGPISSGPTLRINPMSAVAPGFLRKIFEFRDSNVQPPTR